MENIIRLKIPDYITHLAGRSYGIQIAEEQILPLLKKDISNIIEIPNHVQYIAVGCLQGIKNVVLTYDTNIIINFKANDKRLLDIITKNYNF